GPFVDASIPGSCVFVCGVRRQCIRSSGFRHCCEREGEVFFIHTGKGVGKIDADGKLTYIHKVSGGGQFLAWDSEGQFATQFPRLFEKLTLKGEKPTLLYASGGAPLVVNRDGNLYYGSGPMATTKPPVVIR